MGTETLQSIGTFARAVGLAPSALLRVGSGEHACAVRPVTMAGAAPELAVALQQVARAACTDEASPLAGVLVEVGGTEVSVVATNRYWLARWSIAVSRAHLCRARVVIPLAAVQGLARWLVVRPAVCSPATSFRCSCCEPRTGCLRGSNPCLPWRRSHPTGPTRPPVLSRQSGCRLPFPGPGKGQSASRLHVDGEDAATMVTGTATQGRCHWWSR